MNARSCPNASLSHLRLEKQAAGLSAVSEWASAAQERAAESTCRQRLDRLAVDEIADIGDNVRIVDPVVLHADVAEMGGEHDVVELAERMVHRQRLDVEHVEAGAADALGAERVDQ